MKERAILYIVMERPKKFTSLLLENIKDDSVFQDRNCRMIYKAIKRLHQDNQIPYLVNVMTEVTKIVKPNYFSNMAQYAMGIQPGGYERFLLDSIEQLLWQRKQRGLLTAIHREINKIPGDPKEVIQLAEELKVVSSPKEDGAIRVADEEYRQWIQRKGGIMSGFPTLDHLTDGFNLGELVVICGRPTTSKTMMALNMIQHIQGHVERRVGLFSIEMPKSAVIERMKQIYMDLSRAELKTAIETGTDRDKEFMEFYDDFQLYTQSYSVSQIKQIVENEGIEIVFIDFLNIVKAETIGKRYERTTQIISDIKAMTKDLNVLVVVMAQLSRLAGDGSLPVSLDALRDSGMIEEVGDFIIGLCRPEIDEKSKDEWGNIVLALMLKNKRGRSGKMKVHLDPDSGRMREVA